MSEASTTNWRKDHRLQIFAQEVAAGTGLNAFPIEVWVVQENGPVDNPLNIGPGRHYGSLSGAAIATIRVLHQSNMRGILAARGKGDIQILQAIAASPWDAGHYGGNGQNLYATYRSMTPGEQHDSGSASDWTSYDLGDAAGDAKKVGGGIIDATLALPRFLAMLANPTLWVRVLYVLGGSIFLLAGLAILVRELAGGGGPRVSVNPLTNAKTLGFGKLAKVGTKLESKPKPKPKPNPKPKLEAGK